MADSECPLPAAWLVGDAVHQFRHTTAQNIAQSTAKRHGNVEYGEHAEPLLCREEVSNNCGGNGGIGGLPDANQCP